MEFPDLKIEWIVDFLRRYIDRENVGGPAVDGITHIDIQAYLIITALFLISFSWRWWGKKVDKLTTRMEDFNKNLDDYTDSSIENSRAIRENARSLNENTLALRDLAKAIEGLNAGNRTL